MLLVSASCGKDDTPAFPVGPETPGQTTETTLKAGFGPVTYATIPASDDEKQLRSVAFFVETTGGGFLRFFSDETQGSATAFATTTQDTDGNYTAASLKLGNGVSGNATVTVIGNYVENDLAAALKAVATPSALADLKHTLSASGPSVPLLTFQQKVVNLQTAATTSELFSLKRIAARIDMPLTVTVTSDEGDPITGNDRFDYFRIEDVRIVGAKSAAYLLPTTDANVLVIPQTAEYMTGTPAGYTITFYPYEMRSGDAPLEVYIVYKTRLSTDDAWTQQFRKVTVDIPASGIGRNKYYPVTVAGGQLTFVLSGVSDWDEGGMIGG